jgi:MFS family permease
MTRPASPHPSPPTERKRLLSIFGGSAGNLVEWYDWYAYAAFTLYFAPSFFPQDDRTAQLLSAGAIFAVGFLMRPVGAWLMGTYADRHGRKAGLTLSILMMSAGSMLIALSPTYDSIGIGAPLLLVIARLIQGLSVGGEYGASANLSLRNGRSKAPRFLVELSICDADHGPARGACCIAGFAIGVERAGAGAMGLAHPLCHRWCARAHRAGFATSPDGDGAF